MKALSPRHTLQATQPVGEDPSASSIGIAGPRESEVPGIYAKAQQDPAIAQLIERIRKVD